MAELFENNVSGQLASAIDTSQTTLTLVPGHNLYDPGTDWYRVTLYTTSVIDGRVVEDNHEVMKVTGVAGDVVTVERGLEGTVSAYAAGVQVEHRLTSGAVNGLSSSELSTAKLISMGAI